MNRRIAAALMAGLFSAGGVVATTLPAHADVGDIIVQQLDANGRTLSTADFVVGNVVNTKVLLVAVRSDASKMTVRNLTTNVIAVSDTVALEPTPGTSVTFAVVSGEVVKITVPPGL
ncbi:hypothetical protein [Kitasatospora sp. NPDC093806]|uniref:hypothetical protein n=1 Tax=Kitasatospora sp. NPDC093806 TaxID=3155075 RepID=UPI00343A94E9